MEMQIIKASALWIDTQKCNVDKLVKTKEIPVVEQKDPRLLVITGKGTSVVKNGCKIETDEDGYLYLNGQKKIFQLR